MKNIAIPKVFQELHGEASPALNLVLVYTASLLFGVAVIFLLKDTGLTLLKKILAALVFFDVAGGAVANFTTSTNQYYIKKAKLRLPFLMMHIIHPAVLIWVFPASWLPLMLTGVLVLAGGLVIHLIGNRETKQVIAALLFTLGMLILAFLPLEHRILFTFPPLFVAKILLGFSVQRKSLEEE